MKRPFLFLLWPAFLSLFSGCENSETMKLKTMEKPQIMRLYEKHSGKKINSADDFCAEEARGLTGIYCLGWFAHDRGCMGNEILVGNKIGPWTELMPKALQLLGWDKEEKQQKLALDWVIGVALAWESPQSHTSEDFERADTPAFTPPKSEKTEKGWKVSLWVKEPSGMLPQSDYYYFEAEIGNDGSLLNTKAGSQFTVEYNRYK